MLERLVASEPFAELLRHLRTAPAPRVWADGMWGSAAPMLCAGLAQAAKTDPDALPRVILLVTAHLDQADDAVEDAELLSGQTVGLLPGWPGRTDYGEAGDEIAAERLDLCHRLAAWAATPGDAAAEMPRIIVAPVQALMQPVPTPRALARAALHLAAGQEVSPDAVIAWLADHGFARVEIVDVPGDFAVRGGIVDVYPAGSGGRQPVRIDFFGDRIESIRTVDLDTQRSREPVDELALFGGVGDGPPTSGSAKATSDRTLGGSKKTKSETATCPFTDYLPDGSLVAFIEPEEIAQLGKAYLDRMDDPRGLYPVGTLLTPSRRIGHLMMARFGLTDDAPHVAFNFQSLQRFETAPHEAVGELLALARTQDVVVYCDNPAEQSRLRELIDEHPGPMPAGLATRIGFLHTGFQYPAGRFVLVGHHEVFHRYGARHRVRRVQAGRPIDSFLDLQPGDFVVHVTHGIGRFVGTSVMTKGERTEEFLTLRFANDATLHVPASQIHLVQKYVGAMRGKPKLSTLGGNTWKRKTEQVAEAVMDLAADLLRTQAIRESQDGVAYPPDSQYQKEFEESFIYQETEDQLATLRQIKKDLQSSRPMDRLLCGDVGYGKTELAIRAAFKVVEHGKQAAVLVPTTVLAEQHERTFRERFADYPLEVESISRFRTGSAAREILRRTAAGQIDVLIGTHRLLSDDVRFADLGLVVIDEEQRFGVAHKEKLKEMRATVDVLTMTATPIPRTLHMAMLGLRDISSLSTPPMDRRSIHTEVLRFDPEQIRDAVIRELNRDGQVYFLHNRVHSIQSVADRLATIVPEARIAVGHGQMPGRELEKVMLHFVRGEADILVCTTIIESGVDIPNVNTIFIHNCDQFGLAELHQLRGRVGRYKHKAYCYLMLPETRTISPIASRRLKAIEEYSELGAGFRIALRDLEIRGAGNILGAEQSGHISAVGYEMYCHLLDEAVRKLRGQPPARAARAHLELGIGGHLPKGYVPSDRQRMEVYRRLSRCTSDAEIEQLEHDLRDAYGELPPAADDMLQIARLRVWAASWSIRAVNVDEPDLVFSVDDMAFASPVFTDAPGIVRIIDGTTVHVRLGDRYFEKATLSAVLRKMLRPRAEG
ncbi:MAG: Transcription-repair-coupling factor [Phycisphaerae bacterium]|nr:Transcription-repair-coupling factor [Phycisphaerae bacterium]